MKIQVTCPCGCGHTFEIDVKERREVSQEVRARRAEHARTLKSPGRPKGVVETRPRKARSDKGKPRKTPVERFMDLCGRFETDPGLCPFAMANGGMCDGRVKDYDGAPQECTSMITCKHKWKKYEEFTRNDEV